jgi:hypothetical protein
MGLAACRLRLSGVQQISKPSTQVTLGLNPLQAQWPVFNYGVAVVVVVELQELQLQSVAAGVVITKLLCHYQALGVPKL